MEPQATTISPPAPARRPRLPDGRAAGLARRLPMALLLALPGGLTAYTGFHAGGFFAGTQGLLAAGLAVVLVLWIMLADDPLAGGSITLAVAAGALAALAIWTLVSSGWSGAPGRAVLEFDRTLLYLLVLLLFGLLPVTPGRLRWMVRGVALGALAVCLAGLVSRVLPEVLPTVPNIANGRLSYPVTYWNAMGLVASLALLFVVHMACSEQEPRTVRILSAAAVPPVAATLLLTFSRGAIGAVGLGLVVYLLLGRPRLLLTGLAAVAPTTAVALAATYRADALTKYGPTGPVAVAQGRGVAIAIGLCMAASAGLRLGLLLVDRRITRRPPRLLPRSVRFAAAGAMAAALLMGFVAAGGPGFVARQAEVFASPVHHRERMDLRDRLRDPAGNGRVQAWDVALQGWRSEPLHGHGAGTFQLVWNLRRPYPQQMFDAHSVYLEFLAEMGVVGLALLLVGLLSVVVGMAVRARGPDRALYAVLLAASATWGLRAAADWDWEMPVVTLWLFALGGATLAVSRRGAPSPAGRRRGGAVLRLLAALGLLVVAVTPARVALSQHRLDQAVRAYDRDCPRSIDASLGSIEALGSRPEPHLLLAFCNVRFGRPELGLRAATTAAELDPGAWEYHYGLALVQGVLGRDPLPEAREARRLNPREETAIDAERMFSTRDPRRWRERALKAPLPLD